MLNRGRTSKWVKHFVIVASPLFLFLDMGNLMGLCRIHFFKGGNCTLFILTPRIVNYIWYGTGTYSTVRYLCICTLDVHTAVQKSVHVRYMFVTVLVIYIYAAGQNYTQSILTVFVVATRSEYISIHFRLKIYPRTTGYSTFVFEMK